MRLLTLLLLLLVIGCSGSPKRDDNTIGRDPIKATSPEAQARFDEGLQALEAGRYEDATDRFRMLQAEYPNDPIAQVAELYLARAQLADWQQVPTQQVLSVFAGLADDTSIDTRVRYAAAIYLAAATMDDRDQALARLRTYPGPSLSPAILTRDHLMAWSVLAEAMVAANRNSEALRALALGYAAATKRTETDEFTSYARARAFGVAQEISDSDLADFSVAPRSQFLRAVAGYELLRRDGSSEIAARVRGELIAIGAEEKAHSLQIERPTDAPPPVIGVVLPMSGPNSAIGARALNAALLAVGAIGEKRGYTTIVAIDSTQSFDDVTRQLANVSAFVGPLDHTLAGKLAPWARENRKVMLAPVTSLPEPFETTWAFRNFIDANAEPRTIADAAMNAGIQRFAVLRPEIGYGQRLTEAFVEHVQARGGQVVLEIEYARGATDYTAEAAKIAKAKPEAIFIPDTDTKVAELTAFLANANVWGRPPSSGNTKSKRIEVVYLGTSLWQRSDLLRRAGSYIEGAVIPVWSSPTFQDTESQNFHAEYQRAFANEPGDIEAFVYDSVKLLRLSLETQGLEDADALREALSGSNVYSGVTGQGRFDVKGEPVRAPRMITVRKGQFVPFTPSNVDPTQP